VCTPDDEHGVLETRRELKINTKKGICASRWSFTKKRFIVSLSDSFFLSLLLGSLSLPLGSLSPRTRLTR
jgi:hypothetical protein